MTTLTIRCPRHTTPVSDRAGLDRLSRLSWEVGVQCPECGDEAVVLLYGLPAAGTQTGLQAIRLAAQQARKEIR
jgi:hypothetical protein